MLSSIPQHGEPIEVDGKATKQFHTFMEDLADLYSLTNLPDENEIIIIDGKASEQLADFLQDAAAAADIAPPFEGETLVENGVPTFPFQSTLNVLAV